MYWKSQNEFSETANVYLKQYVLYVHVYNSFICLFQGREILQSTVDLVQNNLNLEVLICQTHAHSENSLKFLILIDDS